MPDELTEYLLSDRRHPKLSPEMLELMGKQAANQYFDDGIPLNEGIAKMAGAHPDITSEQVKRIVEFANTAVYLGLHEKAKTAGLQSSYPQFQLADSGIIIQDLTDGARPTHVTQTDVVYGQQPEKRASFTKEVSDELLSDLFGVKTASTDLDYSTDSVVDEILGVKSDLQALKDHLTGAASQLDFMWKEACDHYYETMKRHLLGGGSFTDVLSAARTGMGTEKVAEALKPFVSRLLREKVASPELLKAQANDIEKVAHRVVNVQHPLVTLFRSVLSLDDEIEKVASGLQDVDVELGRVDGFIKERFCAG